MTTLPDAVRVPYDGEIDRQGPQLCPHDTAFPAAMASLRVLMGQPHNTHIIDAHNMKWRFDRDNALHLGVSGEGFRFLFDTAEYFRFPNEYGARPLKDCFLAEGIPVAVYAARPTEGTDGAFEDERALLRMVTRNLADGLPALILGRTEADRVLLATGYEEQGETLVAWSFMPGGDMTNKSFSPKDCQFIKGWTRGADAVALVKGPPSVPAERPAALRRALERGARMLRAREGHPHGACITDFYDEWLGRLGDDAFWQGAPQGRPYIDPEIWDFAERRSYTGGFLHLAADELRMDALRAAAGPCEQMHNLMWAVNALCDGEDGAAKLRAPSVRAQIRAIIEQCRALDAQAAGIIQAALEG